jgi:large subunit ribosomal protein L29
VKAAEVRSLPTEELAIQLEELREELFNLRFQNATGQLDNYKRMGLVRKEIARITTILKQRDLGIETEPEAEEPRPRVRRRRQDEDSAEPEETSAEATSAEETEGEA